MRGPLVNGGRQTNQPGGFKRLRRRGERFAYLPFDHNTPGRWLLSLIGPIPMVELHLTRHADS